MVEKRDEIIDAALDIISEDGFHNLTLARIFNKANTGSGTFYYYFKNKDELVKALYEKCCTKEESLLLNRKDSSFPFEDQLQSIILIILEAYQTNPREIGFVQWYCNNGIEEAFSKTTRTSPSVKAIYNLLLKEQKNGTLSQEIPAISVAKIIRSTVSNVFWHYNSQEDSRDLDEIALVVTKRFASSFYDSYNPKQVTQQ